MDTKDSKGSGQTLREFVDAQFSVQGVDSPTAEKRICEVLGKLSGIQSVSISHGKVLITYEAVSATMAQVSRAIKSAGFRIQEEKSAPASPLTDALANTSQPTKQA